MHNDLRPLSQYQGHRVIRRFFILSIYLFTFLAFFFLRQTVSVTTHDEHVRLAWALLHGHPYIDATPVREMVAYGGHYYSLHPPLSAIFCLPFVWVFGLATDQSGLACILAALCAALVYRLTKNLWLAFFFVFGTIIYYESLHGMSWGFALIMSCVPTLAALVELHEKRRPWLVGIYAALAALARYDLVLVIPVYYLWLRVYRRRDFWIGPVVGLVVYAAFAYWRFGTVIDIGLSLYYQIDPYGLQSHANSQGPFSFANIPMGIYIALFRGADSRATFPFFQPTPIGQAILLTSPAFVTALRAPLNERETWLLWLAVVLGMGASMTVYAYGFAQFGARYWIQVYPFLLALMWRGGTDQLSKVLILVSAVWVISGTCVVSW